MVQFRQLNDDFPCGVTRLGDWLVAVCASSHDLAALQYKLARLIKLFNIKEMLSSLYHTDDVNLAGMMVMCTDVTQCTFIKRLW